MSLPLDFSHWETKEAIEFLEDDTAGIEFNRYTLLNLHALLSNNLLPDPQG